MNENTIKIIGSEMNKYLNNYQMIKLNDILYKQIDNSGIELMLQRLGDFIEEDIVYPHKFRRTLATKAIDTGIPIEQVQRLLGHTKIDTTLHYAKIM